MRKNIKTCIYIVTAILPIVLSACSNKTDNNTPKSTKESATTTFAEDTSSDITDIIEKITTAETTTEEDTTELISETEQDTSEDVTEQQQTQANIQQTTTATSVNSTPIPIQNNESSVVQTTPVPTTTPMLIEITYPNPTLTVKGVNKGEKYSEGGIEFTINSIKHVFSFIDYDGYCAIEFDINISEYISPYCIYNIYDSNDVCIKTGTIEFYVKEGSFHTDRIPSDDFTIVIEFPNSQLKP